MTRVAAVVVTYQPGDSTHDALRALALQATVLVVDNGSSIKQLAAIRSKCPPGIEWIELGTNRGVGAAHNAGIARARALGATHVLLMDQDSVPEPDMVERLL